MEHHTSCLSQFPCQLQAYHMEHTYILFESISLSITSIIDLCDKPLSLLRWDPTSKTLVQMDSQVSTVYCLLPACK